MTFPDAVAACPQRVSAILTKYSSLRSYHEQTKKGSPLDHENAGVYTAALYDAYTDYKIMWKQVQAMISGLNMKELEVNIQDELAGLKKYAATMAKIQLENKKKYDDAVEARMTSRDLTALVPVSGRSHAPRLIEEPLPANAVKLYDPDIFGLELAARDCRLEMIKIVREVDAVTRDPKVACDPDRNYQYLSPSIFRMLLPTPSRERLPTLDVWKSTKDDLKKKEKEIEDRDSEISRIKKILEAALITPRANENDTLYMHAVNDTTELHPSIQTSLSKLAYKADEYRMQSLVENNNHISTGATFFNDLENLESSARPSQLRLWVDEDRIKGICVVHTTGKEISHGQREDSPQHVLKLNHDEVITQLEVHIVKDMEDKFSVTAIAVATSGLNVFTAGTKSDGKIYSFSIPDHRQWSFRGFFGFAFNNGFEHLGIVWGKDIPAAATSRVQVSAAKNLLGMGSSLQAMTKKAISRTKPADHFYLGDCVSTGTQSLSAKTFSALDTIVGSSKIRKLSFSVSAGRLSGLMVEYSNESRDEKHKQVIHGAWSPDQKVWDCEIRAPVIAAKLTVGKTITTPVPFIDTVELVCGDENGGLPLWPLDVSTIRYLGDHTEADNLEVVSKLTEPAPKHDRANWSLRGFYGEESEGLITRLGLIWGCA